MFGMEFYKSSKNPKASPEEVMAALRAADAVARENEEKRKKIEAEHEETLRLTRLMQEEQERTGKPYEIGEKEIEDAEKISGQKFQRLN